MELTSRLLFRLLPMQIFLALASSMNAIISGLFATNFIGSEAMTAVGLYSPINMFIFAISTMLVGGATIMCGKYMGRDEQEKVQGIFSLGNILAFLVALLFIAIYVVAGIFDLTGVMTNDPAVRPIFNQYLIGQSFGLLPLLLGNQLAAFLSIENRASRTTVASFIFLIVNILLNFLFVDKLQMEAFGLALASSLGAWAFFIAQAVYFFKPSAELRLFSKDLTWSETSQIVKIGIPGAASYGYQTLRGLIVNKLLEVFVGSAGVSALAGSDNLMRIAWTLPAGMMAVSRMVISISVGEEDKQTLTDVMRNMFRRFIPLMCAVCVLIMACAVPLTKLYYRDTSDPVFMMTVWGFRILPLCMPLSIICMHFTVYAQATGKQVLVHLLSALDGVVSVVAFTALLIPSVGMNSVYVANVLNGVVTTIVVFAYSIIIRKCFPKNMEELMVIPDGFGVEDDQRMDISVKSMEDVVSVAKEVQDFCEERGIDRKRSYYAGLFLEEMAGNVVDHGFLKDKKKHNIDIRVVKKDDDVIMRIKDDCVAFDPATRRDLADPKDIAKNIGIRMVYKLTDRIDYKNMLGLNVLTVRI